VGSTSCVASHLPATWRHATVPHKRLASGGTDARVARCLGETLPYKHQEAHCPAWANKINRLAPIIQRKFVWRLIKLFFLYGDEGREVPL